MLWIVLFLKPKVRYLLFEHNYIISPRTEQLLALKITFQTDVYQDFFFFKPSYMAWFLHNNF